MAKGKTTPNFPNPNRQPPDGPEFWKRWDDDARIHLVTLFVRGIITILYREWKDLQERDSFLKAYDPSRIGENCRKCRINKLIPQLRSIGGHLNEKETDWAEGKRPEDPADQEVLVKYILGKGPPPSDTTGRSNAGTNQPPPSDTAVGADHPDYRGNEDDDEFDFFSEQPITNDFEAQVSELLLSSSNMETSKDMLAHYTKGSLKFLFTRSKEVEHDVVRESYFVEISLSEVDGSILGGVQETLRVSTGLETVSC